MAGEQQNTNWPLPKFHFNVSISGIADNLSFQEVTGLETETQAIEYRAGNAAQWSTIKMPGLARTGSITLKRGVFADDNNFWNWYSSIQMNTIARHTVTITLMDEAGKATMTWTLSNAWPTKITTADLKADENQVLIETLELAYEKLTIANGDINQ